MATPVNLKHSQSGLVKNAPLGFSWTSLFFGFFPALFRGDIKWTLIMLLVDFITFGFSLLVFPFFYNKVYAKALLEKGYVPADDYSRTTLGQYGIHVNDTRPE